MARVRVGSQDGRDIYRDDATGEYTYEARKPVMPLHERDDDIRVPSMSYVSPERVAAEAEAKAKLDARFERIREREAAVTAAAKKELAREKAERAVAAEKARLTGEGFRP